MEVQNLQDTDHNPLVSIIVITYNSAKFVLETLESAKAQTYQNIELIVSDDCSIDNTIQICQEWIEQNKERFVRTELITIDKNTGIPANCNRGVKAAKGEWVKFIAGDDLLVCNCINHFINYIKCCNQKINIIASNVIKFSSTNEMVTEIENAGLFQKNITNEDQYLYLLRSNKVVAPGTIIRKSIIEELNGFDESFPLIEDYPFWLKATKNGSKIYSIKDVTVRYRISETGISALSNKNNQNLIPNIFYLSKKVRMKYCLKDLPLIEKVDLLFSYSVDMFFIFFANNNSTFNQSVYKLTRVLNPFVIVRKFIALFSLEYKYIKYIK